MEVEPVPLWPAVVVLLLGFVVVDCPAVVAVAGPAAVPVGPAAVPIEPAAVLFCEPRVAALFVVVLGPVLVLLPPIVDPVDPAVCAPAQAKAVSKTGAANHVRFIDHPRVIWWKFRASLPISETQSS
ncbi:MAG: hypothetical protein DMG60_12780 [Acidobacteria bacterium]|nr:MAG: hypothetical protein DMG60_12780 [Acidobacteriota bacterium]